MPPYLFKLPPSQRRVVAQLRRDARKADEEAPGMRATYPWYVNSYVRMLYRRPDINKLLRDPTTDKELGILGRVTRKPTQAVIDLYYGKNHSIGPNQVRGQLRESNEVVGDYLPISYTEWKALERKGKPYWAAEIHDIDLFRGNLDADEYKRAVDIADNNFHRQTGIKIPSIAHGVSEAQHGPLGEPPEPEAYHTPPAKKPRLPSRPTKEVPINLFGEEEVQPMLLQPSLGYDIDQAGETNPPEIDTPPAAQLNIAQPHNISDEVGIPMNQFKDTRKLPTIDCGLGKSDKLASPYATFLGRFKAKRSIATNWHHTGHSNMNERSIFTYMFRHCVSIPNASAVLSPAVSDVKKDGPDGEIKISSAEKDVFTGKYTGSTADTNIASTWYSPYALKELETLSWNINNFKLKPYNPGMYQTTNSSLLPGRVIKDDILFNEDDSLYEDEVNGVKKSVNPHTALSNAVNGLDFYPATPYDPARNVVNNKRPGCTQDSIVRTTNQDIDSLVPETAKLGHYAVQLGQGHLYFTFVNTGDTTMLVDAVVHQGKKETAVGYFDLPVSSSAEMPLKDMNMVVSTPYMVNYMAAHQDNSDRKVSNYVREASDVVTNPETKFLPTSYRLSSKKDLLGTQLGDVYTHVDGTTGVASKYTFGVEAGATAADPPVNRTVPFSDESAARTGIAYVISQGFNSGAILKAVRLTTANVSDSHGQYASGPTGTQYWAIFQIVETANPGFIDIQRKHVSVPPNSRKTIHMIMPSAKYDPMKSFYNGYINDQSYCITFGVTGKTTKVVVPAGDNHNGDGVTKPMSSQFIGRTAAPTSFHIFGHESQTVYPVYLHEEEDKASQINRLRDPQMATGEQNGLQAASYIGAAGRTQDGRYAHLLIDGQPTKKQKVEFDQSKKLNQISIASGGSPLTLTSSNIVLTSNTTVPGTRAGGTTGNFDYTSSFNLVGTSTSAGSTAGLEAIRTAIAVALTLKEIPSSHFVHLPGSYDMTVDFNLDTDPVNQNSPYTFHFAMGTHYNIDP